MTAVVPPPRERILVAADDLFRRVGIRGVGVEAIAEAAGTNKMTLYRHFASKDELVAEWLRDLALESRARWNELAAKHQGDAQGELVAWIHMLATKIAQRDERGCPFANSM